MVDTAPLSVSELTARIKQLLERGFASVEVVGEISRLTRHASGHAYFTIKDAHASIAAVIWRSSFARLTLLPEEGQQYIFSGHISVYEAQGRYQLVVRRLQPAGIGLLAAEFERRKRLFAERGWFDASRKRPIPELPRHIGIVTSPHAAAWQDVRKVLASRPAWLKLTLSPCLVQGPQAPASIARALKRLEAMEEVPDIILLVRGGGSMEDLWCFNDEAVVKAVVDCPVPVISGIGHEIDVTLVDFAADQRAATPSNAAEICCPDRSTLAQRLPRLPLLAQLVENILARERKAAANARKELAYLWRRQQDSRLRHGETLFGRLQAAWHEVESRQRRRLAQASQRLAQCEPAARLRRRQQLLHQANSRLRELYLGDLIRRRHRSEQRAHQLYALVPRHAAMSRSVWERRQQRLHHSAGLSLERLRHGLRVQAEKLDDLDYKRVLARGYTLAMDADDRLLGTIGQVHAGDALHVRFHDGMAATKVQSVRKGKA